MKHEMAFGPDVHKQDRIIPSVYAEWIGKQVPLRGPNRELIGEATVTDVYVEGNVIHVEIVSQVDPSYSVYKSVVDIITGTRNSMSFKFMPRRDDLVAEWLKRKRDEYIHGDSHSRRAIDAMLDEYRARADYGLSLDDDLSQLPEGY